MTALVIVGVLFLIVVVVVVVVVAVMARRDSRVPVANENHLTTAFAVEDEGEARLVERNPEITWPTLFEPRSTDLDESARLRLIHDLALVRAPWCVPILSKALEEERDPTLRRAAGQALIAFEPAAAQQGSA